MRFPLDARAPSTSGCLTLFGLIITKGGVFFPNRRRLPFAGYGVSFQASSIFLLLAYGHRCLGVTRSVSDVFCYPTLVMHISPASHFAHVRHIQIVSGANVV